MLTVNVRAKESEKSPATQPLVLSTQSTLVCSLVYDVVSPPSCDVLVHSTQLQTRDRCPCPFVAHFFELAVSHRPAFSRQSACRHHNFNSCIVTCLTVLMVDNELFSI